MFTIIDVRTYGYCGACCVCINKGIHGFPYKFLLLEGEPISVVPCVVTNDKITLCLREEQGFFILVKINGVKDLFIIEILHSPIRIDENVKLI